MGSHLGILEPVDYHGEVTGTVVMMSTADDKTEEDLLKRTKDGIILHPQPHDDPNDPLNWPVWRRDLALGVIGFQSFIIGGMSSLLASAFTVLSEEFDVTQSTLAYLVGGYMLAMGIGSVFFAPTALLYGKRLIYLTALIVFFAGALWGGSSHSFGMLLGARVVMGLGGGPAESLPSSSIAEIYFLHERAYRLGIYTLLMLGGKNIVPMVAAFIIGNVGWNWVFWILAIIAGMNFLLTFLFVPETWWDRTPVPNKRSLIETQRAHQARVNSLLSRASRSSSGVGMTSSSNRYIPERIKDDNSSNGLATDEATVTQSHNSEHPTEPTPDEKTTRQVEHHLTPGDGRHPTFDLENIQIHAPSEDYFANFSSHNDVVDPNKSDDEVDVHAQNEFYIRPYLMRAQSATSTEHRKKGYLETLSILNGRFTKDKWWMVAMRPFFLYAYPSVLFGTFIYSFSVVWLIVISETISKIFSAHPYNFSTTSVGLLYIATFIGGCLGSAVAGKASDHIVRIMSRRNNGTYEPEFRLVMIIPVLISVTIGMMGFGWSSFDEDLWIVPAVFLGILGFGCSLGSTTAITYAVDSYRMFAAEALVTFNLTKNVLGFLFSLFVPEFLKRSGSKTTFVVFGSVEVFLCLFAIPVYLYGKRMRHWTDRVNLMKRLYVIDTQDEDIEPRGIQQ
jgi:MFS family permease